MLQLIDKLCTLHLFGERPTLEDHRGVQHTVRFDLQSQTQVMTPFE